MNSVKLLDCTLRDGGHVTNGKFGNSVIKAVISDLVKAKTDIIEAGFLWDTPTDDHTARFHTIAELKRCLPDNMGTSKLSLMADNVDVSDLEPCDGTVEYIRLSFRKNELDWASKSAELLIGKGYKVYINPIHGSNISDSEYLDIIKCANELKPYGFSIVDTFGAMRQTDLGRLYYLLENNLDKNIAIGLHLHENLGLSYSLAQYFLGIVSPQREISVDGSLFGMGKVPGNLCIEQIMDYLNTVNVGRYSLEPVYDAIDEFIMPIYEKVRWGYSIPYAISGQCAVHRTYAEYLSNKDRLRTKDIRRILCSVEDSKKEIFDKDYIEQLYIKYINADYDDSQYMLSLKQKVRQFNKAVIIAPGASIKDYEFDERLLKDSCVITVNFNYEKAVPSFCFFTNPKRLVGASEIDNEKIIITSNLAGELPEAGFVISRNELVYHDDAFSDDSTLMLFNLLKQCGVENVFVAGFDGFRKDASNFYDPSFARKVRVDDSEIQNRRKILKDVYGNMNVVFLTPSVYE